MNTRLAKWISFLLITEVLLFSITQIVGQSNGFAPGTDRALDQFLPAVAQNHVGLIVVYLAYVFSGVVLIPIALLLPRVLGNQDTSLMRVGTSFGIISAMLRVISVSRYLFFVPFLAHTYVSGNASTRASIIFAYQANDAFAGTGLGEYLGDGLFLCLWLGLLTFALLQTRQMPVWVGWSGGLTAVLVAAGLISIFIPQTALLTVVGLIVTYIWFIVLAIVLLWVSIKTRQSSTQSPKILLDQ